MKTHFAITRSTSHFIRVSPHVSSRSSHDALVGVVDIITALSHSAFISTLRSVLVTAALRSVALRSILDAAALRSVALRPILVATALRSITLRSNLVGSFVEIITALVNIAFVGTEVTQTAALLVEVAFIGTKVTETAALLLIKVAFIRWGALYWSFVLDVLDRSFLNINKIHYTFASK